MSLVEKAKKKAQDDEKRKREEEAAEAKQAAYLQSSLAKMTRKILAGLREFHGEKTKNGVLRLVRKQKKPYDKTVAVLRLITPDKEKVDLLHVDAAVESGTFDGSDDCRDIPYTAARVSVYVKQTDFNNNPYDYGPRYNNRSVSALGLRDSFHSSGSIWKDNDENVKKTLDEVAEWIAPLFKGK